MRTIALLVVLIVLAGCIPLKTTGPEAMYQNAELLANDKRYEDAITAYCKIVADNPQSPVAADALFEASYLRTFYDNPQKDYGKALAGFDEFVKRYPDHPKTPDANTWRAALKTIMDVREENVRLKKNIEKLNKLDIRQEEKRRKLD